VKKQTKESILAKVHAASNEVSEAATDLDKLLGELTSGLRAEKTTISLAITAAFERLKSARVALVEVEALVACEKEE
jgi:hypothetical protein